MHKLMKLYMPPALALGLHDGVHDHGRVPVHVRVIRAGTWHGACAPSYRLLASAWHCTVHKLISI